MKFNVVSGSQPTPNETSDEPSDRIQAMINENPVFLFMKGNPDMPQCGFSAKTTQILRTWDVPFGSFDVLSDQGIREEIKAFSNWPTIPQLYINKEFVGGCDIITELSETGDLLPLLKEVYPDKEFTPPAPPVQIKYITPQEASDRLKDDSNVRLLDVRSPEEWEITHVESAQLLDQELVEEILSSWDKNTPLLVLCHHGVSSKNAASYFTEQGFQDVSSVEGGINNWAATVDPSLTEY